MEGTKTYILKSKHIGIGLARITRDSLGAIQEVQSHLRVQGTPFHPQP
jgi:hypothetical protein